MSEQYFFVCKFGFGIAQFSCVLRHRQADALSPYSDTCSPHGEPLMIIALHVEGNVQVQHRQSIIKCRHWPTAQ